tara:strand:- start:262 stop:591 length:330 start_codon:yes stop_codon:yes gene_type:complete
MDAALFIIVITLVVALSSIVFFIFNSSKKNNFISKDGTSFLKESDYIAYEDLFAKLECLYDVKEQKKGVSKLGLSSDFISNIKENGFKDLKILISYKKEFKLLNELLEN